MSEGEVRRKGMLKMIGSGRPSDSDLAQDPEDKLGGRVNWKTLGPEHLKAVRALFDAGVRPKVIIETVRLSVTVSVLAGRFPVEELVSRTEGVLAVMERDGRSP